MSDPSSYRPATGSIPTQPGVYRFRDPEGRVVYVGKAKNLRSRLNSYFQDFAALHSRTQRMVTTANSVDWMVVGSEVEALVLEYSWIKEYSPRFNVRFRDDKSYPYLAITVGEEFPRVSVVREAKRKGIRYFGPYAHAWAVKSTLEELIKVFPIRSCRDGVFKQAKRTQRACLLGYIEKCSAPCVGKIDAEDYSQLVQDMIKFLNGNSKSFLTAVQKKMAEAAEAQDYEAAAKWRDRAVAMEKVLERNAVVLEDDTDADLFGLAMKELDIGVQVFHVRKGRISGERFFALERVEDLHDAGYVERILTRFYTDVAENGVPREVLVSLEPQNIEVSAKWLSQLRGSNVDIRVPQRGDKRTLMQTACDNAERSLEKYLIEQSADITVRTQALNSLQGLLLLPEPPLRIECIDISTLQGTDTVGSLVVFEDAIPKKKDYRTFIINGEHKDDLSAIYEVVSRRFKARPDSAEDKRFAYQPSLLVIDGAKGQVEAAQRALNELGVDVPVVGLAKRMEEVWKSGETAPLILPRNSPALHLLQRVRDESHRVAISFHRSKRGKRAILSELDSIPGLGPTRKQALMQEFGSVKNLKQASVEQIQAVQGIGPNLAEVISATFQTQNSSELDA